MRAGGHLQALDSVDEPESSADLVRRAVEWLRGGDLVLGDGPLDYAAGDMLEILACLHDETRIDLDGLRQVTDFARLVLGEEASS